MAGTLCEICNNTATQRCSACSQSRYCTRDCQKSGWPKHKLLCGSAKAIRLEDRPTPASPNTFFRRAILFEPAESKPRFVWLKFNLQEVDGRYEEVPDLTEHQIADDKEDIDHRRIHNNPVLGKQLHHTIRVRYRDNFLADGSKPNKAANPLKPKIDWRGPMVCYAMKGLSATLKESDDLDLSDFPFIVQWFKVFGDSRPLQTSLLTDADWERMPPAERADGVAVKI
ncbi:hypothetical protein P280DRAFT_481109 [Massarina eburnea CBS 473.64]|uniref:MYND-type domain-containing protein n=1 Tax=Massarina eburnea CBS 473.64 TaxID=1395130 RepID=A0A6A6RX30_9PLEO|nr:hypothetical protein P280DRAFT_481109 [Massarina eburnea CBS 473.64]